MYDVAVIGGGVVGKAVALELAEAGLGVASIYRPAETAGQASAAAGAMLGVFSEVGAREPAERRHLDVALRWAARERYATWLARIAEHAGCPIALREGLFVIANAAGDDDLAELAAIREAAEQSGRRAEEPPPRAVPGLAPQRGWQPYGALFLPDEGSVDGPQLLRALDVALARHPRVAVLAERAVAAVPDGDAALAVTTTAGVVQAEMVVLAGGAETSALLAESGLDGLGVPPIFGGRGVGLAVRTALDFPYAVRTPNRRFACGLHIVPRAGAGEYYIGGTNRLTTAPDYERGPALGEIHNLLFGSTRELHARLGAAELRGAAVGYRPVAADRLPLVGRTRDPRILLATGTYRNGMLLAPLIAALIAEEIAAPGRHAAHPYSPLREPPAPPADLDAWLREASAGLFATLAEPGGELPNDRDRDIEAVILTALSLLANPAFDAADLRAKVARLLRHAPLAEVIPSLFELIARQGAARRGQ